MAAQKQSKLFIWTAHCCDYS